MRNPFHPRIRRIFAPLTKSEFWLSIIAGIIVSHVYYTYGNSNKGISFQVDKDFADSVDKSKISINSPGVNRPFYCITGAVWNSGALSIDKNDVREKLYIRLTNSQRLIAFEILEQTYPETSKFTMVQKDSTSLTIDWNYFDPKNGFRFKIVYVGERIPDVILGGRIIYLNKITRVYPYLYNHPEMYITMIMGGVVLLFTCLFLQSIEPHADMANKIINVFGGFMSAVWTSYWIYLFIDVQSNRPF